MEVPYVHGAGNPLKRDDSGAEIERYANEFEDLQKKISDTDEKERSRKRHQQEEIEEMKRKSTSAVNEGRSLAPSPMLDAGFTKVVSKKPSLAITPSSKSTPHVPESARSHLEFIPAESTKEPSATESKDADQGITPLPSTTQEVSKPLEKHPASTSVAAGEKLLETPPEELDHAIEEAMKEAPLFEEKLGKEGEVEHSSFTPEKNLSNLSSVTASTTLSPYTRLTPEMMEMFDNLILHMQVMEESDVRETTFTLGGKSFEGSALYGSKITIREYQKSAPMQYNIEFEGSPEAIEKLSKKMDALTLAFAHGNYAFKVHRFETRISTKALNIGKNPFEEEELT